MSFPVALGELEKLFRKSCGDSVKHLRFETLFEPRATLSEKPGDADSE